MKSKSNNPDAAVQERQTVLHNRRRRTSLGSHADKAPQEDTMRTPRSYELGNPHKRTHRLPPTGSVAQRSLPAVLTSLQGCLVIFYAVTFVTAGSWSLRHQWAGYTALVVSIALCAVLKLNRRSGINSSTLLVESDANTTKGVLSRRVQRGTGVTLLILIGIAIISGWMCTLDAFWGLVWIAEVHSMAAYTGPALLFFYGAVALYVKFQINLPDRYRW